MIVRRTKPNVAYLGAVILKPGLNALSQSDVDSINGDPHLKATFKELCSNGSCAIVDQKVGPVEYPFEGRTVSDMRKLIPEILDVKMLKLISERDERPTVLKAVEKQMRDINSQRLTTDGDGD